MPTPHQHWAYVWVPVVGAGVWCGTLLAMIITWAAQGKPIYVSEDGTIPYISDIGADILKPLFVAGCAVTAVAFFLSLVIERWLRHSGRLIQSMRRRERVFSALAILGSFIGGCGLILLSIFDTKRHSSLHRVFLLVFIVGVGLSAIFTVVEYRWISHDFVELRKLKLAYIVKGAIATALILLAIAFAIALYRSTNTGAILEWTIAFGYTFFLLTFFYDLRMAKGVHKGDLARERLVDMQERGVPVGKVLAGREGGALPHHNGHAFAGHNGNALGHNANAYDNDVEARQSNESAPQWNVYPDGYTGGHARGGSVNTSNGTAGTGGTGEGTMMRSSPLAYAGEGGATGRERGANGYAVNGYA